MASPSELFEQAEGETTARDVNGALLVCRVSTLVTDGLGGQLDLNVHVSLGDGDARSWLESGPDDLSTFTFTAPQVTLKFGARFRFRIDDREPFFATRTIETLEGTSDGFPLVAQGKVARVECREVSREVAEAELLARLERADAALAEVPRPDLKQRDWGYDAQRKARDALIADIAAVAGWESAPVVERKRRADEYVKRQTAEVRRMLAQRPRVETASVAGGRATVRVAGFDCGEEAVALGAQDGEGCVVSLELVNDGAEPLRFCDDPSRCRESDALLPELCTADGARSDSRPLSARGFSVDATGFDVAPGERVVKVLVSRDAAGREPSYVVFAADDVVLALPAEPLARVVHPRGAGPAIGLMAGADALLGAGLAVGSWLDRNGTFGRVAAIGAGVLGGASLGAVVTAIILRAAWEPSEGNLLQQLFEASLTVAFAEMAGIAAGALVGGVVAAITTDQAGTPRGATGVIGGVAMVLPLITWTLW